jgi:hypothetical protein
LSREGGQIQGQGLGFRVHLQDEEGKDKLQILKLDLKSSWFFDSLKSCFIPSLNVVGQVSEFEYCLMKLVISGSQDLQEFVQTSL